MERLADFKKLNDLLLSGVEITDDGLAHLAKLKSLQRLNVTKTKVTADGVHMLQAALPDCEIIWDETADRRVAKWVLSISGTGGGRVGENKVVQLSEVPENESFYVTSIYLYGNKQVRDDDLKKLAELKHLLALYLNATPVTDKGIAHLNGHPSLAIVSLNDTNVSDKSLEILQTVPCLHALYAQGCRNLTERGVRTFLEAQPNLLQLTIGGNGMSISDGLLASISELQELDTLLFTQSAISDAAAKHIGKRGALRRLTLQYTGLTDVGIEHLRGLERLSHLRLGHTAVTDAGLRHLEQMKTLRELFLIRCNVTAEGVRKLQVALPDCEIIWDGSGTDEKE